MRNASTDQLKADTRKCIADTMDLLARLRGPNPHLREYFDEEMTVLREIHESLPEAPPTEVSSRFSAGWQDPNPEPYHRG